MSVGTRLSTPQEAAHHGPAATVCLLLYMGPARLVNTRWVHTRLWRPFTYTLPILVSLPTTSAPLPLLPGPRMRTSPDAVRVTVRVWPLQAQAQWEHGRQHAELHIASPRPSVIPRHVLGR